MLSFKPAPAKPAPAPVTVGDAHLVAIHSTPPTAPMPPAPAPHLLPIVLPPAKPAAPAGILGSLAGALGMAPPQPAPAPHLLPITMGGALPPPTPAPAPTGILGSIAGALGMAPPQPAPVLSGPQNYLPLASTGAVDTVSLQGPSMAPPIVLPGALANTPLQPIVAGIAGAAQSAASALAGPMPNIFGSRAGSQGGGAAAPSGQMVGGSAPQTVDDAIAGLSYPVGTSAPMQPAAAPTGFLSTPIVGPVTPAELGLGAVALGVLGKVLKWW